MQEKGLQEVKVLAKAEDAEMLGQSQWPGCLEPQGRVGCSGWSGNWKTWLRHLQCWEGESELGTAEDASPGR